MSRCDSSKCCFYWVWRPAAGKWVVIMVHFFRLFHLCFLLIIHKNTFTTYFTFFVLWAPFWKFHYIFVTFQFAPAGFWMSNWSTMMPVSSAVFFYFSFLFDRMKTRLATFRPLYCMWGIRRRSQTECWSPHTFTVNMWQVHIWWFVDIYLIDLSVMKICCVTLNPLVIQREVSVSFKRQLSRCAMLHFNSTLRTMW